MPTEPAVPRVVHCKREPYDVYIGRPGKWGNPYRLSGDKDRTPEMFQRYRTYLENEIAMGRLDPKRELRGKTLGCWCAPKACHGDVLLEVANAD